ncbi:MAG TPA: glycosyltransferase [Bryobacteraceae bacterium]|nr:glycosyltransferase [Bryobacteraceae bacterium]
MIPHAKLVQTPQDDESKNFDRPGVQGIAEKPLPDARSAYMRERCRYWDDFASNFGRWETARSYYQQRLAELYSFVIPPGMRVLELGSGGGDLLARLRPSRGVGVDLSAGMNHLARERHPELEFIKADAHFIDLNEKFDFIVCSDLVNDLWDVQQVFEAAARHAHPTTRLLLNAHSRLWEIPRHVARTLGMVPPQLQQNWLTVEDIRHLLTLTNFEVIRTSSEIMWPIRTPGLDTLCNRYLVKLLPFRWFGITNFIVARPAPSQEREREPIVSVVVPARNEEGNIANIFDRVPEMGAGTELIFVEGNSKDGTYQAIEREIALRPERGAKLFKQPGKGKGDAVRLGFAQSTGDLLMILDADLTVPPEDLPRFYEAWRSGKGDFINGVRLVYPMEERAMQFFNLIANKFFGLAFSWLFGQTIKDTLCGTKVLSKEAYQMIASNRSYFGDFDPFGDFDLLFGAAKYNLKIVDLPIRYRERVYGETNIQRWRHGVLLLRMVVVALGRLKFA